MHYWPREIVRTPIGFGPEIDLMMLKPDDYQPITGDFYSAQPMRPPPGQTLDDPTFKEHAMQHLLAMLRRFIEARTNDGRAYFVRIDHKLYRRKSYSWMDDDDATSLLLQVHGVVLLMDPREAQPGDAVHEIGWLANGGAYGPWRREYLHDGETMVRVLSKGG